jgi:transposase InsO family protein
MGERAGSGRRHESAFPGHRRSGPDHRRLGPAASRRRPHSRLPRSPLHKTELVRPRGPWRTAEQVELATLDYVYWFNHRRLLEACGDIPPADLEAAYYRQNTGIAEAS